MTFKELPIGAAFKFNNRVSTFSEICLKVSPRCYTWRNCRGELLRSRVGTIKVAVIGATIETKLV